MSYIGWGAGLGGAGQRGAALPVDARLEGEISTGVKPVRMGRVWLDEESDGWPGAPHSTMAFQRWCTASPHIRRSHGAGALQELSKRQRQRLQQGFGREQEEGCLFWMCHGGRAQVTRGCSQPPLLLKWYLLRSRWPARKAPKMGAPLVGVCRPFLTSTIGLFGAKTAA